MRKSTNDGDMTLPLESGHAIEVTIGYWYIYRSSKNYTNDGYDHCTIDPDDENQVANMHIE
jgi:hypothetical protein